MLSRARILGNERTGRASVNLLAVQHYWMVHERFDEVRQAVVCRRGDPNPIGGADEFLRVVEGNPNASQGRRRCIKSKLPAPRH